MKNIKLLFLIVILSGCSNSVPSVKTGLEGKSLPSFKLLLADSSTYINTKEISNDKPFVIFCFGPHCPYSHAQMEQIISNISLLSKIKLYAITPWPFNEMKSFYNQFNLNKYDNIVTGYDVDNIFEHYYKIPGVPYTAIYGKDKKLKQSFVGKINNEQIKEILEN